MFVEYIILKLQCYYILLKIVYSLKLFFFN